MTTFDEKYELRFLKPAIEGQPGYDEAAQWNYAVASGFYELPLSDEQLAFDLKSAQVDQREYTGVYERASRSGFPNNRPIATFETYSKTLNVGAGNVLDASLVSAVTVRSDHRRQGILSRMMHANLARAKASGHAVAALTASEGGIYGRFGFGPATFHTAATVDVRAGYSVQVEPVGAVQMVPTDLLFDIAPRIFERYHSRQVGSLGRQERYRYRAAGLAYDRGKKDEGFLAATWTSPAGEVEGYVVYKHRGFETPEKRVEVRDLVGTSDQAQLELWRYLGTLDLVDEVIYNEMPVEDPLPWALSDPRRVRTARTFDAIWLRILDLHTALERRSYVSDGCVVIDVRDRLGLAQGVVRLNVTDGIGKASKATAEEADVSLDIADLSSAYLGGVSVLTLAAAGKVREVTDGGLSKLHRTLAPVSSVNCQTYF